MSTHFEVVETPQQLALTVKKTTSIGQMPKIIGGIYGSIASHLLEKGEQPAGPPFIAYFNMDMENLMIEVGFPIHKEIEGEGEIKLSDIPGGRKAIGTHKGSYEKLASFYDQLTEWLNEEKLEPTGVVYEYYLNSPEEVPESELLTKVEFLLK